MRGEPDQRKRVRCPWFPPLAGAPRYRALCLGLSVLPLLLTPPLGAAVITVNKLDSSTVEDGLCALREAILAANGDLPAGGCPAGSGADTIVLTGDVTLDLVDSFDTGTPRLTSEVTIRGNGHTIERSSVAGTPKFRIFWVRPAGDLTIKDTTIRNGFAPLSSDGGGIYNEGKLSLVHSILASNTAEQVGGAIYSGTSATLLLVGSGVESNTAVVFGGGIMNYGAATIIDSYVSLNRSSFGGGVLLNLLGEMTLVRTLVTFNEPVGIELQGGTLHLTNGAIARNFGLGLSNSGGTATLLHSTIAGNWNGALVNATSGGTLTVTGSIVAENTGSNCSGTITDAGSNLVDDATCAPMPPTPPAQLNLDPVTLYLYSPSVAINAAGDCGLLTDGRGALRDASCDIGAYEYGADDQYEISGSEGSDDTCYGHAVGFGRGERHLHTADFSDWVWFQPVEGATYEIETSNLFGGSDTVLELWSDCTPPQLDEDDDGGTGLASKIAYTATVNDEQTGLDVLIRDFSGQADNRGYDVTVTCVTDCPSCPLGGGVDFVLRDEMIVIYREIEACNSITAFDTVVASGVKAVLRAGSSVGLGNGFAVPGGAELVIDIDPDLQNLGPP